MLCNQISLLDFAIEESLDFDDDSYGLQPFAPEVEDRDNGNHLLCHC